MINPKIFYSILNSHDQRAAKRLLLLILFMALFDSLSVLSLMPLISLWLSPEVIFEHRISQAFIAYFGILMNAAIRNYVLFGLSSLFIVFIFVSLACRAWVNFQQFKFTAELEASLGSKLFDVFLKRNYDWYFTKNSSDLTKIVLSEVGMVINQGYIPLLNMVSYGLVSIFIIFALVIVDWIVASSTAFVFLSSYLIVYSATHQKAAKIGKERLIANQSRFRIVGEAFSGIKTVKVTGLEQPMVDTYKVASYKFAKYQLLSNAYSQLPRYLIEGVGVGCILVVTSAFLFKGGTIESLAPTIAVYAFAGLRLLPAVQNVYRGASLLKYVGPTFDAISSYFAENSGHNRMVFSQHLQVRERQNFALRLDKVTYRYPNSAQESLKDVSLTISKGEKIGIVGSTGSGKSTLLDLIVGLIEPSSGNLFTSHHKEHIADIWQIFSYLPQEIFLVDGTIIDNVTLGNSHAGKSIDKIKHACRLACIDEFIEQDLPLNYATEVGEAGIRISGGQKQRIGLARALYADAPILVLDEATSALDNETEAKILKNLYNRSNPTTVIVVAHRLTSLENVDRIVVMDQGEITAIGSFDQLKKTCVEFQRLIKSTTD